MDNYVMYHDHTYLSNPTAGTSADSVANYKQYADKAKSLGMSAMAISEHGNVFNWINKKDYIESPLLDKDGNQIAEGIKYIHANEVYLTKNVHKNKEGKLIRERDNYHYMLIAKNWDGVKELNSLTSDSFNKEDGHFYFNPRITFDELKATSDNILMTSACIASPLWRMYKGAYLDKKDNSKLLETELEDLLQWMTKNKHRMFFEIQYHNHPEQIKFNQWLLQLSSSTGIPLIAGTDTHSLDAEQAKTREVFLKAKGASYGDEDTFDLTFKTYEELVGMFEKQNALPRNIYLEAIHNTNVMADMIEDFKVDDSHKYPKLYDKPIEVFKEKINKGFVERGIHKFGKEEKKAYLNRISEEFNDFKQTGSIDYMLLQKYIADWCIENDIRFGFGRGSVNGSLIAYILGITEMDSVKHNLSFSRFINPERVSLADIDVDFPPTKRQDVIDFVASIDGVEFSEIITFNTYAMKGAIRAMAKGLGIPDFEADSIAKSVEQFGGKDRIDDSIRNKYPELFKHVDNMIGVVFAIGSHPSGFLVSPIDLKSNISTVFTDKSKYRVSSVNMKELDGKNWVKLDILGLMNIELINETCKLAGIERLTPDNVNTGDKDVWMSMKDSTLGVFQMESDTAHNYIKRIFSDETLEKIESNVDDVDYIDLLSMANAGIRPAGDSYRDELAKGIVRDNGHEALNALLKSTLGYLIYQEQIIDFLINFCGYTGAKADIIRRGFAKKTGTEQYIDDIHNSFVDYMKDNYKETEEHAEEIIESFLQVIEDASNYGFSDNHSKPYSYTGYIGAWLRYYYPLEFLATALNLEDEKEQIGKIIAYAKTRDISILPPEFGKSRAAYSVNYEENSIYKGVESIGFMNYRISEELYELSKNNEYDNDNFIMLVKDIIDQTSADTRQMEILIRLDYFKNFGDKEVLLEIYLTMVDKKKKNDIKYPMFKDYQEEYYVTNRKTKEKEIRFKNIKFPMKYTSKLVEKTKRQRLENIRNYELEVKKNPPEKIGLYEQISFEKDNLGYAVSTYPQMPENVYLVLDINKRYTPWVTLYRINNGEEVMMKIDKKKFWNTNEEDMVFIGDVIQIKEISEQPAKRYVDNKWIDTGRTNTFIEKRVLVRPSHLRN